MNDVDYKDIDSLHINRSKEIGTGVPQTYTEKDIENEERAQEQGSLIPFLVTNILKNQGNIINHLNSLIEITSNDDFQITPNFPTIDFSFCLLSIFSSDDSEASELSLDLLGNIWRSNGIYPDIINPEMFQILFDVYNQENTTHEMQSDILYAIIPLISLDEDIREFLISINLLEMLSKFLLNAKSESDIKTATAIILKFIKDKADYTIFLQFAPHVIHLIQNENINIREQGLILLKKLISSDNLLEWFANLGVLKALVYCAEKAMINWNSDVFEIILKFIKAGYMRAFSSPSIYTSIAWCLRNCKEYDVSSAINIVWHLSDNYFNQIDKHNTYMEILKLTDSAVFANRFASCRVLSKYMCICDTENLVEVADNGGLAVIAENIENLDVLCQLDAVHALARLVRVDADRYIDAMVQNGIKDSIETIQDSCESDILEQKINELLELVVADDNS